MLKFKMPNYKRRFQHQHTYFLTIITHKRNPILIENIELLRESFRQSKRKYRYDIDAIVILPDHIHMLITPQIATDYPKIISSIKSYFSRYCDERYYVDMEQSKSRNRHRYKPIWQKRYYEHTIRDEFDMYFHLNYIEMNPVKHGVVEDVSEWVYSSFYG